MGVGTEANLADQVVAVYEGQVFPDKEGRGFGTVLFPDPDTPALILFRHMENACKEKIRKRHPEGNVILPENLPDTEYILRFPFGAYICPAADDHHADPPLFLSG